MIPEVRAAYNKAFTDEAYSRFRESVATTIGDPPTFRLAETPIFLPEYLVESLLSSCDRISEIIADPDVLANTASAIREPYWSVPGDVEKPLFLQYDYALCKAGDRIEPWLIELQGFPSLYCFQGYLGRGFRQNLPVPDGFNSYFKATTAEKYRHELRTAILNGHPPENVILLEIEPEKQNTRIDFYATEKALGVPTVGLETVEREGKQLFYRREGRRIPINRIYNRVILDELLTRQETPYAYTFREDLDVEWAGHPDWFLRISKHTLPVLGHLPNVPATIFASDYVAGSYDLSDYILKPLYSFSGAGVNLHPTEDDIAQLERPANWIVQRRVAYEPVLHTPTGLAKCEVRMMLMWLPDEDKPRVVNNLVRITKGEMTGVKYNKDKDWVGASVAMHRVRDQPS